MMGLLRNLCAASLSALLGGGRVGAGGQVDLDVFADMDAGDAFITHLFEGALDGFALRVHNGLLGGDDDFCFHARAPEILRKMAASGEEIFRTRANGGVEDIRDPLFPRIDNTPGMITGCVEFKLQLVQR